MKTTLTHSLLLAVLAMICSSTTQAQFTINGEFKMRGEYRDGYGSLRDSSKTPYADILGRARLGFDYNTEKITTRFSVQDAWVFGQNYYSSDTITKNTINIFEAWFRYNFNKQLSLKIGRTEVIYDDERLFGISNWNMWGATHDIMILHFRDQKMKLWTDIGFAANNVAPVTPYMNSYDMRNNYKYMGFLYANLYLFDDKFDISFLNILDAFQKFSTSSTTSKTTYDTLYIRNEFDSIIGTTILPTTVKTVNTEEFPNTLYARNTIGGTATLHLKNWTLFVNGFYQFGKFRDGRNLNSYFYGLWCAYQPVKQLKIMAGWEQLSGNNFSDTTTLKTKVTGFSTLYGTSHSPYGYMDMFAGIVKNNLSPGLNDLYARATIYFTDKMNLEATYRWFSLPYSYLYRQPTAGNPLPFTQVQKSLGSEIDLMYIYKPIPNLEINAAYCFFLPTSAMETFNRVAVGKSEFAQYAYLMVTYKPNFFSTAKN